MSGKSGKVASGENYRAFEAFIEARKKDENWEQYILPSGRHLNKEAILKSPECNFGRSVFVQNPAVKRLYAQLEAELTEKKILLDDDNQFHGSSGLSRDEAMKQFEDSVARLEKDIEELNQFLCEIGTKAAYYESEVNILIIDRVGR